MLRNFEAAERGRGVLGLLGKDRLWIVALLLVWIAVWLPRLRGPIDLRWDASTYYVLGTAIAEGKGYSLLNEPGQIQAIQYPPLLPAAIAAAQRIIGTNDFFRVGSSFRLIYFVLSGLYLIAIYAFVRSFLPAVYSFIIGAITALSFNSFIFPSESLYAELPFAFVSMLFLLCHRRAESNPVWAGLTAAFAIVAYLLRTAGVALLAAWVLESIVRRRFIQAGTRAAIALIPILAWQNYISQVKSSNQYQHPLYPYQRAAYYYSNVSYLENSALFDPFRPERGRTHASDLVGRLARNSFAVPLALGESSWFDRQFALDVWVKLHDKLNLPLEYHWRSRATKLFSIVLVVAGLLMLGGAVLTLGSSAWFLGLYFFATIALVVLTPWPNQFWRYLAPIAPIALLFLVNAVFRIRQWLSQHAMIAPARASLLTTVAIPAMLLPQLMIALQLSHYLQPVSYYDGEGAERVLPLLTYQKHWHSLDRAFEWIRRNARSDTIIATSVPHLAFLRTGHQAVLPPLELDAGMAARLLDEVPASILVLDELGFPPISNRYVAPMLSQKMDDWRLTYTVPGTSTKVYERTR
jgi:hypothetical protein